MLEQKKEGSLQVLEEVLLRGAIVEAMEDYIDRDKPLYLMTWNPDPKETPDADFYLQHNTHVSILSDYLKCCYAGLFCVESTQLGNPHYHGWYQIEDSIELARIAIMKTLQRFGMVKVAKARSYKINDYNECKNALYYYKKDLLDTMLAMVPNPISKYTESTVDFDKMDMIGFFSKEKNTQVTLRDKISDRKFYRDFYTDSISTLR